jgi:hypothetical protein
VAEKVGLQLCGIEPNRETGAACRYERSSAG